MVVTRDNFPKPRCGNMVTGGWFINSCDRVNTWAEAKKIARNINKKIDNYISKLDKPASVEKKDQYLEYLTRWQYFHYEKNNFLLDIRDATSKFVKYNDGKMLNVWCDAKGQIHCKKVKYHYEDDNDAGCYLVIDDMMK